MAVVDDDRELASAGGHSDDEKASALAAKDQSDAAERDAGFESTLGDIRGLPETPEPETGGGAKLSDRIVNMLKKRLAIALVVGVLMVAFSTVAFIFLLFVKLVHFEENIVHFFDNRTKHAISKRQGPHYRAIFDAHSGHPQGFDQHTGHPLADQIANFRMDRMETDLQSAGLASVHDRNGKLVGFYDLPDLDKGQKASVIDNAIEIRDKKGKLVSRDRLDSYKFHDLSDSSVKERRSYLRTQLAERFPDDGFFRRSIRARKLDARFGIRRKLLATTREKIADKEIDLKRQLADAIRARVLGTDGVSGSNSTAEEEKKNKIKEAGDHAGGGLNKDSAIGVAYDVCGIYGISKAIHEGLFIIRESQLMRFSISLMATAHQIKDRGNVQPRQLKVLMQDLSGIERSGGFKRISGDTSAKVNQQKVSLDGGGNIQKASKSISSTVDGIPLGIGGATCNTLNSSAGQAAGSALTIIEGVIAIIPVADLADVAAEAIGQTIRQGANYVIMGEATKAFIKIALDAGKEPAIDLAASATDKGDAMVAGYDSYSNNNARSAGGTPLTAQQVSELTNQSNLDQQYAVAHRSLAYKLFSTNYDNSLTNRLAMATPSSFQDVSTGFTQTMAVIFPGSFKTDWDIIKKFTRSATPNAIADSGDSDPVGAGVPQYGITDQLLDKYPSHTDNENWVIAHLAAKGQKLFEDGTDSSTELTDQNNDHDDDYHKFVRDCLLSDDQDVVKNQGGQCGSDGFTQEERERYVVYRFDLGIANENNSYNNDENDQGSSSDSTNTSSADIPTGDVQSLAKQILNNPDITFDYGPNGKVAANFKLLADGKPAQTDDGRSVDVDPIILKTLVYLGTKGKLQISSLTDGPSHTASINPHGSGKAVDVDYFNGHPLGSADQATTRQVEQYAADVLPEHSRFGADFYPDLSWSTPISIKGKTYYTGNDTGGHLHMDVVGVQ